MNAMTSLGNGLHSADRIGDALCVEEAELATFRRIGASGDLILATQNNLAISYDALGRSEQALQLKRDVYSGRLKVNGEEHNQTLIAANNYVASLVVLKHFAEAKALLRKTMPMVRRNFGESNELTLGMRANYAAALCRDDGATLDDFREAVATLEDTERITRRVFGSMHPFTIRIGKSLKTSRAILSARDRGDVESLREAFEAMTPGDA